MTVLYILVLTAMFNGKPDVHFEPFTTESACMERMAAVHATVEQINASGSALITDLKGRCARVTVEMP